MRPSMLARAGAPEMVGAVLMDDGRGRPRRSTRGLSVPVQFRGAVMGNADSHYNAKGRRTATQKGPAERGQVTHEGAERVSLSWLFHGRWRAERKKSPDARPGLRRPGRP